MIDLTVTPDRVHHRNESKEETMTNHQTVTDVITQVLHGWHLHCHHIVSLSEAGVMASALAKVLPATPTRNNDARGEQA